MLPCYSQGVIAQQLLLFLRNTCEVLRRFSGWIVDSCMPWSSLLMQQLYTWQHITDYITIIVFVSSLRRLWFWRPPGLPGLRHRESVLVLVGSCSRAGDGETSSESVFLFLQGISLYLGLRGQSQAGLQENKVSLKTGQRYRREPLFVENNRVSS